MMKRYAWIKALTLALTVAIGGGIAHYYFKPTTSAVVQEKGPVYSYSMQRDLEDIRKLFIQEWYWLTRHEYSLDYLNYILTTQSPNDWEPNLFGKLHIKVLRDANGFEGFVAYHMLSFYEGKVLFLAVRPEARGKHYGEKLLLQAIKDLYDMGAQKVWLAVRTDNKKARAFYARVGLVQTYDDGEGFCFLDAPRSLVEKK